MKQLVRFGVSLDHHLLDAFDGVVRRRKYATRSEALRDLIRDQLVSQEWSNNSDRDAVATITFVYDHHVRNLTRKLTHIQHDFQGHVMAGMHVHLDGFKKDELVQFNDFLTRMLAHGARDAEAK